MHAQQCGPAAGRAPPLLIDAATAATTFASITTLTRLTTSDLATTPTAQSATTKPATLSPKLSHERVLCASQGMRRKVECILCYKLHQSWTSHYC